MLQLDQLADCPRREVIHPGEFLEPERHVLGRRLDLNDSATFGQDQVHVRVGARVLGIVKVEQDLAVDDTDAYRRDVLDQRVALDALSDRGRRGQPAPAHALYRLLQRAEPAGQG